MTERKEGRQNALIHEGREADAVPDTNERADEAVEIRQPDGATAVPQQDHQAQD